MVVARIVKTSKTKGIDTLVLGCTHYPLLKPLIQNFMGDDVTLVDSGVETVGEVSMLLDYFDIAANEQPLPPNIIFTRLRHLRCLKKLEKIGYHYRH